MGRSRRSQSADRLFDLPRPVWLLGWVSLATDSASEAIYPLLPFFLTSVLGAGAVSLGIVEGAADAVNSILKVWSGRTADRMPAKRPLVVVGYSISSLTRPLIAVARSWTHVFAVRTLDRVGKGIRGAPRDAMLAVYATPETRGKVYGFHRAMDHAGAVLGPALASLFLLFYPGAYRTLFALTIGPGAVAVILIFLVREDAVDSRVQSDDGPGFAGTPVPSGFRRTAGNRTRSDVASGFSRTEPLPRKLKAFFFVLTLFTLGNSTDAFLLLKLTDVAGTPRYIPLLWAALHVVKAGVSMVGGSWSDRIGRRSVIALGWLIYAAVYVGFAIAESLVPLVTIFLIYGFYF